MQLLQEKRALSAVHERRETSLFGLAVFFGMIVGFALGFVIAQLIFDK